MEDPEAARQAGQREEKHEAGLCWVTHTHTSALRTGTDTWVPLMS